tara:strand:- start:205 stop:381 length:177 start_codon:yes stop_codon:yes gene_type:complete
MAINAGCHWCGRGMVLKPEPGNAQQAEEMATIEHLIPRSQDGSDDPGNLALAHKRCNR